MWIRFVIVRRAFLILLLICLGCSAQSPTSDITQKVERQVRAHYSLPADMKVSVSSTKPSEFPGYDALAVTLDDGRHKQNLDFLLSKDQKTLVRFSRMDLTSDPFAEIMKRISVAGRPTRGNKDAKVVAVNFDDFQCPFCARLHQEIFPAIFKEYGDRVLFIYKDFPLEDIHPWAVHASVNANCLAALSNDAYWDYADYLHGDQRNLGSRRDEQIAELDKQATLQGQKHNLDMTKLQACVKGQDERQVRASMREGEALDVSATPQMFVNGQKVDGAVPPEVLREVLDRALKDAGVAPPDHKAAAENTSAPPQKAK